MTTLTQPTLMTSMRSVGVPLADVSWFHTEARPRDFKGDGDAHRARRILRDFYKLARSARIATNDMLAKAA